MDRYLNSTAAKQAIEVYKSKMNNAQARSRSRVSINNDIPAGGKTDYEYVESTTSYVR